MDDWTVWLEGLGLVLAWFGGLFLVYGLTLVAQHALAGGLRPVPGATADNPAARRPVDFDVDAEAGAPFPAPPAPDNALVRFAARRAERVLQGYRENGV